MANDPMRVLFLTHAYPRSTGDAAGSFVLRLARALREQDVEVEVVAPAAEGLASHDAFEGVPVERFRYAPRRYESLAYTGTMAEQVQASWSARLSLVGFLGSEFTSAVRARRRFEPQLVHAHWWFPNGLAGTWVARLGHIPLVTTFHGTDIRLARGVPAARPLLRHVVRHSARITAVSHWLAREAAALLPGGAMPTVAPMPASTDLFHPDGGPRGDRLLFVGRLKKQKGVAHLLRALSLMRAAVALDIAGTGEEEASLRQLAASLGLSDRVRWLGQQSQEGLAELYRRAAAVVVPSIDEGLGLVAVEAQLSGVPVIGADSGGLPDVIHHERTGLLVAPGDPAALAAAVDGLFAREDRGLAFGEAGRMYALATFAPESAARRYAEVYRSAAGNGRE